MQDKNTLITKTVNITVKSTYRFLLKLSLCTPTPPPFFSFSHSSHCKIDPIIKSRCVPRQRVCVESDQQYRKTIQELPRANRWGGKKKFIWLPSPTIASELISHWSVWCFLYQIGCSFRYCCWGQIHRHFATPVFIWQTFQEMHLSTCHLAVTIFLKSVSKEGTFGNCV